MKNHILSFEEFLNESNKISHFGIESAAVQLAHSMPNHTKPDDKGNFSDEQIENAIKKYSPILKQHLSSRTGMKEEIISRIKSIVNES
jgi:hypothetical protein